MVKLNKEQKHATKQSILKVSKKHFLEKGFDKTKTKDIAKEVGIAEGTIFNYFDTKTDILIEAMAAGYIIENNIDEKIEYCNDVIDIIFDLFYRSIKPLKKLPKSILKEMLAGFLNIAKRRSQIFRKLMDIDYNFIGEVEDGINKLVKIGRLKPMDARELAEVLYGSIFMEMLIYIYEDDMSIDMTDAKIKKKLHFILDGYII